MIVGGTPLIALDVGHAQGTLYLDLHVPSSSLYETWKDGKSSCCHNSAAYQQEQELIN